MFFEFDEIYLRELRKDDLNGTWFTWFNNKNVTKYQDKGTFPNTIEKQSEYYDYLLDSKTDVVFAIIDKKSNKHIGNIGVHHIDYIHRRCEIGIVIGEHESQGKGYAFICINIIKEYIFNTLNLRRITVFIMSENISSIKSFEKCGFIHEGVMKEYFYKNGKYLDNHIYGLINE